MTASPAAIRQLRSNLTSWTIRLMAEYPGFDEFDLAEMIEEKTGVEVTQRDFVAIEQTFLRQKLRAWTASVED